jgi:hypothetical protein
VCRELGISEATFYVWKKKYANLGGTEIRELRQLREENAKLKRLVADQDRSVADGLQLSPTAQRAGQQEPGGVLGWGNDGDDCAAFFPGINGPKTGPTSSLPFATQRPDRQGLLDLPLRRGFQIVQKSR